MDCEKDTVLCGRYRGGLCHPGQQGHVTLKKGLLPSCKVHSAGNHTGQRCALPRQGVPHWVPAFLGLPTAQDWVTGLRRPGCVLLSGHNSEDGRYLLQNSHLSWHGFPESFLQFSFSSAFNRCWSWIRILNTKHYFGIWFQRIQPATVTECNCERKEKPMRKCKWIWRKRISSMWGNKSKYRCIGFFGNIL